MKATATYQGITKEELEGRILYIQNLLANNEMEAWQAREFRQVISEYEEQLGMINEAQLIIDDLDR